MKSTVLIFTFLLTLALSANSSLAQSFESAASRINEIKRDTTYIYAEATTKDKDDALVDAKAILEANINQWISSEKKDNIGLTIAIAKLEKELSEIQTTRGDFYRAFVYVKKSSVKTIDVDSSLVLCGPPEIQSTAEIEDHLETSIAPVVVNLSDSNFSNRMPHEMEYQPTEFEKSMLAVNRFEEIKPYINMLKEKNLVLDYGKYQTIPSFGECYIFIYDKIGNIPAYLHRTSMNFVNIKDGSVDNIDNYNGCGALWFSLK